jgi:hypothetical protein
MTKKQCLHELDNGMKCSRNVDPIDGRFCWQHKKSLQKAGSWTVKTVQHGGTWTHTGNGVFVSDERQFAGIHITYFDNSNYHSSFNYADSVAVRHCHYGHDDTGNVEFFGYRGCPGSLSFDQRLKLTSAWQNFTNTYVQGLY